MRNRVVSLVGLAIFAMPVAAVAAGEAHAPPTLTPLVARDVAGVCPGTARYALALTWGITERDAAAAAPLFDACAASLRHGVSDLRRQIASTAVGATYLSLGLLRHDPALLRRSIDATAEVRNSYLVSDEDIRRWPVIPDEYDVRHREAIVRTDCSDGGLGPDAAYINVAAHAGSAWVTAPRDPVSCPPSRLDTYLASRRFSGPEARGFGSPDRSARPSPAIEPDLANPGSGLGQPPPLGGR
jgi:hypothetical protein